MSSLSPVACDAPDKVERDHWLAIELRHLAALATVAREASFSGAAERLGYVQSAVSQQIGSLERIVGQRLVHRAARPRSVRLTDAGQTLLDHIDEILDQLALAKAEIDTLSRQSQEAVNFGVDAAFGSWLSGAVLGALLPATGGEGWERVERRSGADLLKQVADGALDAAFVPLPIASGPFFALELTRQPYSLVAPADGGEASVEAILERWPLVRIDGCPATALLQRRHRSVTETHAATGPAAALALVRSGVAAAMVIAAELDEPDPSIAALPVTDVPDCVIGMAWHRDRDDTPAVVALKDAAQRAFTYS
jgi:DNA-binding transcriptional LysR family regulator